MDFFPFISNFEKTMAMINPKTFSVNFLLFVNVIFGALHFCSPTNKKVTLAQFWLILGIPNFFVYRATEMLCTKILIYKQQEID